MIVAYKLFKTEAEARAHCNALNVDASEGIRFIVEKQIGGEYWIIVKQQERKVWSFAEFVQEI